MDPEDGVIEGFMIEKIENDKPLVYIFLDEDWKKQVKDTKILWGNSWAFNKSFEFKSIEKGIYLEVIEDDRSRFSKDYGMSFYGENWEQLDAISTQRNGGKTKKRRVKYRYSDVVLFGTI